MNLVELVLLAAIWGASFLFMRIAAPQLGPIPLIALRVMIAAVVLAPVLRSATARRQCRAKAWPLFVVGVTNSAIPFSLFAFSTLYIHAGLDSILNATTPLWAALIMAVGFQGRLRPRQVLGLLLGLLGVVVLVWNTFDTGGTGVLLAVAAALTATLFYGFAVNYARGHLGGVQPLVVAFGSQMFASAALVVPAVSLWPAQAQTPLIWASVAALGIVCTGFAYVLYFRLIARAGPTYAASVTFLIPVFGVLWGAVFLGERVTPNMIAGCPIVLLGIALTNGAQRWKKKAQTAH
ncbi:MAG: DMT family transporter [Betaproteobacteria bacterium]|nr:DMT family transporter [Betaproteobacteria bacterium]